MPRSAYSLLRLAGLLICLMSGATALTAAWIRAGGGELAGIFPGTLLIRLFGPLTHDALRRAFELWFAICVVSVGIFASTFLWITLPRQRRRRIVAAALIVQTLLGILVADDFLILTSFELPFVFPMRIAGLWLAFQELTFLGLTIPLIVQRVAETSVVTATGNAHYSWLSLLSIQILAAFTNAAWHGFAFCGGYLATSRERDRNAIASAHAELLATQQLLEDGVRAAERLRIARDLHDSIGHHLMALGLHLEVAAHAVSGKGQEAIAVARELTQRLTAEVREAVGTARAERPVDLKGALAMLCAGIPAPEVQLSYDEVVTVTDVAVADIIFRSVQEGISNAVRHADARKIGVQVTGGGQGVVVSIFDDGHGGAGLERGNGLNGMNERVTGRGGRLDIVTSPGEGMALRLWLPLASGGT
jgi:signal transduction histidine kinase